MRIAFIGLMHSGKSTAAQHFVDKYGAWRPSFADPVKDIAVNTLNNVIQYLPKNDVRVNRAMLNEIKNNPHVRNLLQFIGTELGREWTGNPNIWIDTLLRRIDDEEDYAAREHNAQLIVVNDDCRFQNEAQALRENGFVLVRVHRDEDA